jgi:hypothetical protein
MRHLQQEYQLNKNVLPLATRSLIFQLVELSLQWLLSSRASVRFTQRTKIYNFKLTQFIEQTRLKCTCQHLLSTC